MGELQFEAPLANFDGEEWNEFGGYNNSSTLQEDIENCNIDCFYEDSCDSLYTTISLSGMKKSTQLNTNNNKGNSDCNKLHRSESSFDETFSGSLEDLVNNFDDKVTKCFKNLDEQVEVIAPVQNRSEDDILNDCQTWWTLTGQYGNLLPINWSRTYRSVSFSSDTNLREDDMSKEDDELYFTNDQLLEDKTPSPVHYQASSVIEELENIMRIEDDQNDSYEESSDLDSSTPTFDYHIGKKFTFQALENKSIEQLKLIYSQLDDRVQALTQLALKVLNKNDQYKFEKELKNSFVCLMIGIQTKRRSLESSGLSCNVMMSLDSSTSTSSSNSVHSNNGRYLTTVIPYKKSKSYLNIQQLQTYVKILLAIDQDSSEVPKLLTDYILKVLCPAT